ncbi:MAG: histidine--tRNA ligase [Planctomycetes bacterium]|nr:histidine--tRNA ligase [Planctomycetota bacterium]
MRFQNVKGTRDFYPPEMRVRNWIVDAWRRVSLRNGFEEYDSPIFEYLDLFTAKSGEEIAEQLFSFTDRGGRRLAIRPEITPALARMVNARIQSLPQPIKWFSVPRLCRAENPQRGRLREFFQWNVDIIGSESFLADAECIFAAVDLLREVGLDAGDVAVRIGSRPLVLAALSAAGVPEDRTEAALAVLDKRPKLSEDDFRRYAADNGLVASQVDFVCRFQDCRDPAELRRMLPAEQATRAEKAIGDLEELLRALRAMGAGDFCELDLRVVRGLAYYTGVVYEIFDRRQALRALAGGGRYDNLLEVLGGPKVPATGFGMGDVVLAILLEEKHKLPAGTGSLDFFVADAAGGPGERVLHVVGALRRAGLSADFSHKGQSLGKQLKAANRRRARAAVIVKAGDALAVKDLAAGRQVEVALEEFLRDPRRYVPPGPAGPNALRNT